MHDILFKGKDYSLLVLSTTDDFRGRRRTIHYCYVVPHLSLALKYLSSPMNYAASTPEPVLHFTLTGPIKQQDCSRHTLYHIGHFPPSKALSALPQRLLGFFSLSPRRITSRRAPGFKILVETSHLCFFHLVLTSCPHRISHLWLIPCSFLFITLPCPIAGELYST